ncbi:MAG: PLP-dependent aspartate aminotransferase family protein [Anaerolineae bacterium]|nr:PLP-dependent aspartate aminotransferase family protein [Anaerolineae bacterium]
MKPGTSTQAVHGGEDKRKSYDAITTPIVQTSTYTFEDTSEILSFLEQKAARKTAREGGSDLPLRGEYGRYGNPTILAAEGKLAAVEGADRAVLFATGMNAITTTFLTFLSSGDHAVVIRDSYRRTREFAMTYLPRWGIETTMVGIDTPEALATAVRPNTKLIFTETPTNPYLRILDLSYVAEIASGTDILTAVDSTFATPINMRPLELGIDLVIHSATKYLAGHNDLLAGVVLGRHTLLSQIENMRGLLGGFGGPQDAYLLLRGLKTLGLRIRQQNATALKVAQFLEDHPAIEKVYYPGLPSHPDHDIAVKQMGGFGGVVSFELAGGKDLTSKFIDHVKLPYIGPTLGGVESIIQQQALFVSLDEKERRATGIRDNLVRYALGIEDAEDIIADLAQALDSL